MIWGLVEAGEQVMGVVSWRRGVGGVLQWSRFASGEVRERSNMGVDWV